MFYWTNIKNSLEKIWNSHAQVAVVVVKELEQ
jgi:hypothetical protein